MQRREGEERRQRWPGGEKEGMKRRETDPASNQFPKCSPPSGTHRDSERLVEKKRGKEEAEVTWWRQSRVQKGKEQASQ